MAKAKEIKYPLANYSQARVSSKASILRCIDEIKEKFKQNPEKPSKRKTRQLQKFVESCFGTLFLRMKNITFSGCLVHHLLLRQTESMSNSVMEFNVNGKGAIFTLKEFGIITGLKIDHSIDASRPPPSTRLLDTYFGGRRRLRNSEFREIFSTLKAKHFQEKNDMVKICLLYFLECGLLGKESQTPIDLEHFSMVEDLNYFNQYPWGLEAYEVTISSMHKVLHIHQGGLNDSGTYSLSGFPLAFQV